MRIPKGILLLPNLKRNIQRHQHTFTSLQIWRLFIFLIASSKLSRPLPTLHLKEEQHTVETEVQWTGKRKGPSCRDASSHWEKPLVVSSSSTGSFTQGCLSISKPGLTLLEAVIHHAVARGCGTVTPSEQPAFLCERWGPLFSPQV